MTNYVIVSISDVKTEWINDVTRLGGATQWLNLCIYEYSYKLHNAIKA